ncbi:MAG TPA: class I SAM-dependent methyltransferase [Myxococcota bacterium]|nr:class I SAM-dependent methyltransferase [Myxococcota bacterium]
MNTFHRWYCRSATWRHAVRERLMPWVLAGIDLGRDVLEVGPGPGLTTDVLAERVPHLTCVEKDPALAASLARRRASDRVEVFEADATDLPFPAGRFSGAVSCTMLHHVPSVALQDRLLGEVARVLAPGAWLVGSDSLASLLFRLAHWGDTMVLVDPDSLGARLERAGFGEVRVDRVDRAFRFQARRGGGVALVAP